MREVKEQRDQIIGLWRCFPNATALGSFDFMTQTIELAALTVDDIRRAAEASRCRQESPELPLESCQWLIKVLPLAAHEYTHFQDATATLWGLECLTGLYQAYETNPTNRLVEETGYYKARVAENAVRKLRYPDYYTVIQDRDAPRPWRSELTLGTLFGIDGRPSGRPVFFLKFATVDGVEFARSPVSLVSMLEVSATANELAVRADCVSLLPKGARVVEAASLQREVVSRLYDKELTEYSVCAHLVANNNGIRDSLWTYHRSAALVQLCLNFPKRLFGAIKVGLPLLRSIGWARSPLAEEILRRIQTGLSAYDRETLFFLLASCCSFPAEPQGGAVRPALDRGLQSLGINLAQVEEVGREDFLLQHDALQALRFKPATALVDSALPNFDAMRGNGARRSFPWSSLQLPPVMLGDLEVVPTFLGEHGSFAAYDLEQEFSRLVGPVGWIRRFSEACIG